VRSRLAAAIAACQAAVTVLCLVDLGLAAPAAVVVALGIGAACGALLGVAVAAVAAGPRPAPATAVALGLAAAAWIAGHAGLLVGVGQRFRDPQLMGVLMVGLSFALVAPAAIVFAPARRGLERLGRRPTLALGAALAAAAAVVVLPGPRELAAVALAAATAAAVAILWRRRAPRVRRGAAIGWAVASVAAVAAALSPLGDDAAVQRGRVTPAVTAWLRPLLDRDGDGRLAVLGDGDCAEGDAARAPTAIEVPGDGVDQDCRYGDLAVPPPPPPAREPAARRLILLTLAEVDTHAELRAALPALAARIDAGVRFDAGVPLSGKLRRVAPVLLTGRLLDPGEPDAGGFAPDGLALPQLLTDAGWQIGVASAADLSDLTTVFPSKRAKWKKDSAAAARAALPLVVTDGAFLWLHVKARRDEAEGLDAAIEVLLRSAEERGYRALVVTDDGAPLALLGGARGVVDAPVSGLDVYPTLRALAGIAEPVAPGRPPAPGRSLAGEPGPVPTPRAYVAGLRDAQLGARLRWRNLARAAGLLDAPPDDLAGATATIRGALHVLGCRWRHRDDDRLEVGVVMQGGEHLRPDDLVEVMVKSSGVRVLAIGPPVGGALPFGTWPRGSLVEHTVVVHRSLLGVDDPVVWVSVVRRGKRLKVTHGEGASRNAAPICAVEL
jgi:hypothetical protein